MTMETLLLGLDIGTSAVDACAFTPAGALVASATVPLAISYPRPGWVEQAPCAWVDASFTALLALSDRLGRARDAIAAIGLTGQCPSCTLADDAGNSLAPGLIYQDNRALAQTAALETLLGSARVRRRAGMQPMPFHLAPKVLWLGEHYPDLRARRPWLTQPRDLVAYHLTGTWATDTTHAGCTLLYDLATGTWAGDWIAALGLDWLRFPAILPPLAVAGRLSVAAAAASGLPAGIPVAIGAADNFCADLGMDAIAPGVLGDTSGTSTCLDLTIAEPDPDPALSLYAHFVPGLYFANTGLNATGAVIGWAAGILAGGDLARLERLAAAAAPDAHAPLFVPYLTGGERTAPGATGIWHGLSLAHGPERLARSVYEGLTFALRALVEQFRATRHPITRARLGGGGAGSTLWTGLKADIWGLTVETASTHDVSALGAAMLAGCAARVYRGLDGAVAQAVSLTAPRAPDCADAPLYDDLYRHWGAVAQEERPA